MLRLVEQFPLTSPLELEQVRAAIRVITECHRWQDLSILSDKFAKEAIALNHPTLRELVDVVFRFYLKRTGKPRVGDKTPTYINIVPQLKTMYADAKFIHLIRDGRDVAMSFVDASFRGRCYHGAAFEWTKAVRSGLSYRSSPFASDLLEVRYETLVSEPEKTVRTICEFLGEAFEPSMLDHYTRLDLVPERERDIHLKLGAPISENFIASWSQKLSPMECFVMEASLGKDLEALGYPLRFSSSAWRPLLHGIRLVTEAFAPVLDYAVPALRRRGIMSPHGYI